VIAQSLFIELKERLRKSKEIKVSQTIREVLDVAATVAKRNPRHLAVDFQQGFISNGKGGARTTTLRRVRIGEGEAGAILAARNNPKS
jgi:hypothetical protein